LDDHVKKNEPGGACTTYGREMLTGFWWGNMCGREHLEFLGVNGRMILKWIFKKWYGGYELD
jgi:hypothetical protein